MGIGTGLGKHQTSPEPSHSIRGGLKRKQGEDQKSRACTRRTAGETENGREVLLRGAEEMLRGSCLLLQKPPCILLLLWFVVSFGV